MDEDESTEPVWVTFTNPAGDFAGKVTADESALDMLETIQAMGALDGWTIDTEDV